MNLCKKKERHLDFSERSKKRFFVHKKRKKVEEIDREISKLKML
jgi:hypothetical protein